MHDYAHHCFGIGLSLLAVFLIFGALRHRRHHMLHGYYGYGPGFHAHGWGPGPYGHGPGSYGHGFGFRGMRFGMLRRLFARLDTTPGQEKAIKAIAEDLRERMKALGKEDAQAYLDGAQGELVRAYVRVLETLDDKQKAQLAELIASRF